LSTFFCILLGIWPYPAESNWEKYLPGFEIIRTLMSFLIPASEGVLQANRPEFLFNFSSIRNVQFFFMID